MCVCLGDEGLILFQLVSGHEDCDSYNSKKGDFKWSLMSTGWGEVARHGDVHRVVNVHFTVNSTILFFE